MGNFDVTTPVGSDLLSQGDDKIREFKLAVREALRAGAVAGDDIEGVEAIFPGASPSSDPVYRYRGLKGTTSARPTAGQYGLYFDTTRSVLQRDNGTSWEDIGQVVLDGSITEAKLSASVAGNGLSGGANTPLSVNVGSGLEISSDTVRIAAAAAGNGLSGGAGSALDVNVDNSTIEINSDTLRVKDGGIGFSKIGFPRIVGGMSTGSNSFSYGGSTSFNAQLVFTTSVLSSITSTTNTFTVNESGLYLFGGSAVINSSWLGFISSKSITLNGMGTSWSLGSYSVSGATNHFSGQTIQIDAPRTFYITVNGTSNPGVSVDFTVSGSFSMVRVA